MADQHGRYGERWFTLPSGALLWGDGTGGITVAGLTAWKDCPDRTAALSALAEWCRDSIAERDDLRSRLTDAAAVMRKAAALIDTEGRTLMSNDGVVRQLREAADRISEGDT